MGSLLAWQNLVFYIPLGSGLLLLVGAALGASGHGESDHDADGDHADGDHAEGDHHGSPATAPPASTLPLLMRLGAAAVLFGGVGATVSQLALPGGVAVPLAGAGLAALLVGPLLTRLAARFAPTLETYSVSRRDLLGQIGVLVLPAGPESGLVQVRDHEGNLHQLLCRTEGAQLASGAPVLILHEDPTSAVFTVELCPPDIRPSAPPPFLES
jgi:hypothetical protein